MQMIISLVLWVLMGSLNAYFAYKRGRDPIAWFMIGVLLGILGLGILFLLPRLEPVLQEDPEFSEADELDRGHDYTIHEWYFLDSEHKQQGPVKFKILQTEWLNGKIHANSLVWSEGMQNWSRVSELPGLKDVLAN